MLKKSLCCIVLIIKFVFLFRFCYVYIVWCLYFLLGYCNPLRPSEWLSCGETIWMGLSWASCGMLRTLKFNPFIHSFTFGICYWLNCSFIHFSIIYTHAHFFIHSFNPPTHLFIYLFIHLFQFIYCLRIYDCIMKNPLSVIKLLSIYQIFSN